MSAAGLISQIVSSSYSKKIGRNDKQFERTSPASMPVSSQNSIG
jgi:hypothetical protein